MVLTAGGAVAQQTGIDGGTAAAQTLPDDPSMATVSGTVTDVDGALVAGATVTLSSASVTTGKTVATDSQGRFKFVGVVPGNLTLSVSATGLAPGSASATVQAGQIFEAAPVVLRVATANSEVMVTLTKTEIATEDVRVAETQRFVGFIPNYYVSYSRQFVPLDAKQKFGLGFHVVLDPTNFLFAAVTAGIEQANDTIPGYGRGPDGYGKRYGAALALASSATLFRGALFPALFHQDPRYFYKGTGTVWARTWYALSTAVRCKGDNGRWQPNYAGIVGDLSAGALTNAYYPASSRDGAALTFENGLLSTAGVGVGHVLQEFLFKRLTTHTPKAGATAP